MGYPCCRKAPLSKSDSPCGSRLGNLRRAGARSKSASARRTRRMKMTSTVGSPWALPSGGWASTWCAWWSFTRAIRNLTRWFLMQELFVFFFRKFQETGDFDVVIHCWYFSETGETGTLKIKYKYPELLNQPWQALRKTGSGKSVNMFSAFLHVRADFLRSTTTLVMSLMILLCKVDSTCIDAYSSVFIGVTIFAGAFVGFFKWIKLLITFVCKDRSEKWCGWISVAKRRIDFASQRIWYWPWHEWHAAWG